MDSREALRLRGKRARQAIPRRQLGIYVPSDRSAVEMVLRRSHGS